MKFLNPAGLWLLLGIPVLIIIYLIRPHHEERAVSSTFMWKLSQKFMKKQLPLQRLKRFLLFLLQVLLIVCAAIMVARPALITGKSTEYIAIIDASASMQTTDENGVSRFDRALKEAQKLTEHLSEGHRVTVILAGESAQYLIQSSDSPSRVQLALDGAACGNGGCNTQKALSLAQQMANRGKSKVIFYTDTASEETKNVELKDLSKSEWNISIESVLVSTDDDGNEYIDATLTSRNGTASATVGMRIDGALVSAKKVEMLADEQIVVSFSVENLQLGSIVECFVDLKDGLAADNSYVLCTGYSRMYNVLLVSENPFYLENALLSLENCSVAVTDDVKMADAGGFDLYIFDGIYPEEYPVDGSVVQFGTEVLPEGLESQAEINLPSKLSKLTKGHELYENLNMLDTTVAVYRPLAGSAKWEKLLNCGLHTVCMTSVNDLGMRTTVFSFDLHQSNLPMQTDYIVLMKNIIEASVFDLIPGSDFAVGASVDLAVLPNAQEMYLSLPDGNIRPLTPDNGRCTVSLDQTGVYTAVVTTAVGGEFGDFFVHIPEGESQGLPHSAMSVVSATETEAGPDAITELWMWFAAAILLLLILEWGVYFREQY